MPPPSWRRSRRTPWCLLPAAVLASAAATGLVVGLFVVRYRDIFFGMLNLALSMVFYSLLEKLYAVTRGTDGIRLPPLTFAGMALSAEAQGWTVLVGALVLALLCGAGVGTYLASPMGQALAGIKTREQRLEFLGVSARRVLLVAYVLSAALAGLGGAVLALATRQVTPALAYWTTSGELVFIAILGGAASAFGPFLGAAAYELTRVYAAATGGRGVADDPGRRAAGGHPVRAGRAVGHGPHALLARRHAAARGEAA